MVTVPVSVPSTAFTGLESVTPKVKPEASVCPPATAMLTFPEVLPAGMVNVPLDAV